MMALASGSMKAVNVSIMDAQNKPRHYPFVVDLELRLAEDYQISVPAQ